MPFQYDSKEARARKAVLDKAAGSRKAESAGGFEEGAARLRPKGDPRRTELYDRGVDVTTKGYKGFDLKTDKGITDFVASLNVSLSQRITLKGILASVSAEARVPTAQVLEAFSLADKGTIQLEHVTLCGDLLPDLIWNSDNPEIEYDILRRIAQTFPIAARQVEDLVLSAKYEAREDLLQKYFELFPSLDRIYAHADGYGRAGLPRMQIWWREGMNA